MSTLAVTWQTVNLQICTSLGFLWEQQILHVRKVAAGMCLLLQNCAAKGPLKRHTHSNKTQDTDTNVLNLSNSFSTANV